MQIQPGKLEYPDNKIPESLMEEIREALASVKYGSVEIYLQGGVVTQITVRNIKKTNGFHSVKPDSGDFKE